MFFFPFEAHDINGPPGREERVWMGTHAASSASIEAAETIGSNDCAQRN
jgi:hypothetical protein